MKNSYIKPAGIASVLLLTNQFSVYAQQGGTWVDIHHPPGVVTQGGQRVTRVNCEEAIVIQGEPMPTPKYLQQIDTNGQDIIGIFNSKTGKGIPDPKTIITLSQAQELKAGAQSVQEAQAYIAGIILQAGFAHERDIHQGCKGRDSSCAILEARTKCKTALGLD